MQICRVSFVASLLAVSALSGCSILPSDGPQSRDVVAGQAEPGGLPYAPIKLTTEVLNVLEKYRPRLSAVFADRSPPKDITFGVGDVVSVTIFEAVSGGLFIPADAAARPGNFISLPNQQVDSRGNISVPYAGNIQAKGRTQVEVQTEIVNALKSRAVEPQVVVSLIEQRTSLISVLGDVGAPARITASQAGERILDAITRVGGPKSQGYDEWVMLERGGKRAIAPFGALVYDPSDNIFVHGEDTIYVYKEPQTYLAFGAVGGSQSQINFDAWRLSLAEAVAKFGGLSDSAADAAAVFVYRGETREVATKIGVDVSKFLGPIVPIIYQLNLRDPSGFFLATKFEMRNKDVIFVANAQSVELLKAMNLFRSVVGTVNDPITAAEGAYALRAAIKGATTATTIVTTVGPTASP